MPTSIKFSAYAAIFAFMALAGCTESSGPDNTPPTVTLGPGPVSLTLGGASATAQVTASVKRKGIDTPNAVVDWTTSDAAVATVVGSGLSATITGRGHGTATITATSSGVSAGVTVNVTAPDCVLSSSATLLTAGTPANGTLAISDCRYRSGPADFYRFVLTSTQNVTFNATSTAIGPQLTVFNPTGNNIGEDLPLSGLTSSLTGALAAGTYQVAVTSRGGAAGSYTLTATTSAVNFCSSASAISQITPTAAPGTTISGSLSSTDCRLNDLSYADIYRLNVTVPVTVQIDMTSALPLDAYIVLYNSDFSLRAQDDDSGGGTNARLTATLPVGTYYIAANSESSGQTGNYTLIVKIP